MTVRQIAVGVFAGTLAALLMASLIGFIGYRIATEPSREPEVFDRAKFEREGRELQRTLDRIDRAANGS